MTANLRGLLSQNQNANVRENAHFENSNRAGKARPRSFRLIKNVDSRGFNSRIFIYLFIVQVDFEMCKKKLTNIEIHY